LALLVEHVFYSPGWDRWCLAWRSSRMGPTAAKSLQSGAKSGADGSSR